MAPPVSLRRGRGLPLLLAVLLALSAYGNAVMSQFDAPYGPRPALEAILQAVGGGLLLYAVIPPLLSPGKKTATAGFALLAIALLATRTGYALHLELYGPTSYAEYLATSTILFIIGVPAGILLLPMIPWLISQFIT